MRLPQYLAPAILLISLLFPHSALPASKLEIDARVRATLDKLYAEQPVARELGAKASAVLVFPRVIKVGIGIGGAAGEGSLLVSGSPVQYYRATAASIGFQLGAQAKSNVVMFMSQNSLDKFRASDGWEAGVDGSVAIVQFGVGKEIDTHNVRDPIIGFVFGNQGLMYDLSLEGTKFWKINK